jgi:hypothetical protein
MPGRRSRRHITVVPSLPATISVEAARERRRRLGEVQRTEMLWRERFGDYQPTSDIRYEGWSASESARRDYQLRSTALLLAGRVTDTVLNALEERFRADITAATWTAVEDLGYQCLVRRRTRPAGTIGYFVQIECRHPDFVASLFTGIPAEWLGIETIVVYGEPPRPLAELTGEIGGYLRFDQPVHAGHHTVGMTCHHARNFRTLRDYYRTSPQAIETPSPDAQLVAPGDDYRLTQLVEVASDDAVRLAMYHRSRLTRAPKAGRPGEVFDLVETFPHLGHLNRFPSMRIRSPQLRLFGFLNWPPRARFGRPGDSGSWAMDSGAPVWMGMVVAGRPDLGDTYAHCAAALYSVVTAETPAGTGEVQPSSVLRG